MQNFYLKLTKHGESIKASINIYIVHFTLLAKLTTLDYQWKK